MNSEKVRQQFNKQAKKYAKWSVTKNQEYLKKYSQFCQIAKDDSVLDVACGSGDFCLFLAPRVKSVCGIDLSDNLINLAKEQVEEFNLENVTFICDDFQKVNFKERFSMLVCRMAFHHFPSPKLIFDKMLACSKVHARIGIQDIVAYSDDLVSNYFDQLERYIDCSHHRCLKEEELLELYEENNLKILNKMILERDIAIKKYIEHAEQDTKTLQKINHHIQKGLQDPIISNYLYKKNGEIYFKRKIFLILGEVRVRTLSNLVKKEED
ncbi:methyltransferase family protein [Orenia metallireducens]|jgi:ubiquinone/menaquinone biosynthesis C-methylase UbiE|uniref:Methyltransferase domain-containing protein n=1 Tax=Orenia metallireducens TaxID=1413210 RepID=A0A285I3I9_9FIRM|nr:class I SAM-dependent methyltransferase [Orenia metallireducens]PRX23134.1 methyltransferase family protein [Orenia metallireducens]SNY42530.1 Methyltransferase domain-containing protein [Orenia metallireducens]